MALKITRTADSIFYLGRNLNTEWLKDSCDYQVWVRRVNNRDEVWSVVVNILTQDGVSEQVLLDRIDPDLYLGQDITITLEEIQNHMLARKPFCPECGRGDTAERRPVPQARLAISAPAEVTIMRDDAKKKS